jgi:hypothetical protein
MAALIVAAEKADHTRSYKPRPANREQLDMGFYSRLREINENCSFSVNG